MAVSLIIGCLGLTWTASDEIQFESELENVGISHLIPALNINKALSHSTEVVLDPRWRPYDFNVIASSLILMIISYKTNSLKEHFSISLSQVQTTGLYVLWCTLHWIDSFIVTWAIHAWL